MSFVAPRNSAGARKKPSVGLSTRCTADELGALVLADPDVALVLVELPLVDHWPDLRFLVERVADSQRRHPFGEPRDEPIVDRVRDDQPRRCGAALPGRIEGTVEAGLDRDLEIGVVEHHHRVLAAHLELELAHHPDRGLGDAAPGAERAGEADRPNVRAVEDRLAGDRPLAHDEIQHASRQARHGAGCRPAPRCSPARGPPA
jgi:hypothetical protein